MSRTGTAIVAVLVLAVACTPAIAASEHSTLSVGDATVAEGESTTIAVTLSSIPDGLSGFNVTVAVGDAETARITDADVTGFGLRSADIETDGSEVLLKGIDTGDQYTSGDGPVQLATVTIEGVGGGTTPISLRVGQVDDDDGGRIVPARDDATVTVGSDVGTTATETAVSTDGERGTDESMASDSEPEGNDVDGGGAPSPDENDGPGLLVLAAGSLVLLVGAGGLYRRLE